MTPFHDISTTSLAWDSLTDLVYLIGDAEGIPLGELDDCVACPSTCGASSASSS